MLLFVSVSLNLCVIESYASANFCVSANSTSTIDTIDVINYESSQLALTCIPFYLHNPYFTESVLNTDTVNVRR